MRLDLRKYWEQGSVMGLAPREAITLRVTEGRTGWWAIAHTGDGTKPGSAMTGAGGFDTPEAAFKYLIESGVLDREATDA